MTKTSITTWKTKVTTMQGEVDAAKVRSEGGGPWKLKYEEMILEWG
jgi:hypothetical protein